jgi:hypothetical protein
MIFRAFNGLVVDLGRKVRPGVDSSKTDKGAINE